MRKRGERQAAAGVYDAHEYETSFHPEGVPDRAHAFRRPRRDDAVWLHHHGRLHDDSTAHASGLAGRPRRDGPESSGRTLKYNGASVLSMTPGYTG